MPRLFLSHLPLHTGLLAICVTLTIPALHAQAPAASTPAAVAVPAAPAKATAFDSIAIHPGAPNSGPAHWGVGPDSYTAIGMPLSITFYMAFFPAGSPVRDLTEGMPAWVSSERYDITAKVDAATAEAWKSLTFPQRRQHAMPLIQQMLADRFKMQIHRVPTQIDAFALVVSKGGPKLTVAAADETAPSRGNPMPEGGWMAGYQHGDVPHITFNNASMAAFATNMTRSGGVTILNQTGLTGRYDFVLPISDPSVEGVDSEASTNERAHYWDYGALGLELKPIKIPAEKIVIDHIERPSAN